MGSETADWRSQELFDRALYDRLDEETGGAGLEIIGTLLSVASARRDPETLASLGPVIRNEFDAAIAVITELRQG